MNANRANYGHYAIAISIALLACSIVYFSTKLSSLEKAADSLAVYHDVAPDLVAEVEKISVQIPAIVREVALTREKIPAVLAEISAIRKVVPSVVEQIPPILSEVSALRETTVPAVLVETAALRKETIPSVLNETAALRKKTIPDVLSESKALREDSIPSMMSEVRLTREEMPLLLAQAKDVARSAGQNASEGAVSGFFSGIIKAPLNLVSGVGGSIFKGETLTPRDKKLLTEASARVLDKNQLNAVEAWRNPESSRGGKITLTAMVVNEDERCRELTFDSHKGKKSLGEKVVVICHDEKGVWAINE